MKQEWRHLLLALGFFTRIPVPNLPDFKDADLNHAAKYFPLIGILVGLVAALVYFLAHFILTQSLAVLISMAATIYLTGAFHEDGLADSADGLGGGWNKERILTIMQDSRLGTYGATALFLMLFAKFQTINAMSPIVVPVALISGHALSRLAAVWVMRCLVYVRFEGKSKPLATAISTIDTLIAHMFGLAPYLVVIVLLVLSQHAWQTIALFILLTSLPVLCVWWWWAHKIQRWLGGYTGDTLGAIQQMTELAFYLGVLVWSLHV
ncbi:adenosylcobinamide-GDP ribazoletransferase [Methylotenera sp. 1P/1]|uniref:adenosylcobinamide-GDP ribazoletransferase n=1 Tax=Methylotenera sp. 1P/1 TaxID=1131551 RepID=UPI0003661DC0|nr:adenosylcobinamide-GDP ribazoletransferase [Methylotenera sp. 1P/1]